MNQINFKQAASQRIYDDYMKRTAKVVATLSKVDQRDVLMEFNSHIFEGLQNSSENSEINSLLDVLQKLGMPEEVLIPLIADKKLEQATKTFNPVHVFKAMVLNISNGISYTVFSVLYLALGFGGFLILAKLINTDKVGLFIGQNYWVLGISTKSEDEVLGNWFIPVVLGTITLLYVLITLLLKLIRKLKQINL